MISPVPHGEPAARVGAPAGAVAGNPSQLWQLTSFSGQLAEISAGVDGAPLTLVFKLVLEAQQAGEPVAWISARNRAFFPPDVADVGVDLDALVVVWAAELRKAVRAADYLVRSGGFGVVILDLGGCKEMSLAVQSRLGGLARKHDVALLCLTEKDRDRPSLGSLVTVRAEVTRLSRREGERFRCEARFLKDKRRGPGGTQVEICRGPDGLR